MNDARLQGIDRQHLTDALVREDGLKLELEAAQKEVEQLKHRALYHESQLQELNSLLEAESAKTSAELMTRQNVQATACHYRAKTLSAQQKEKIANQHCEAAESEILRLQREVATERHTTATANRLLSGLREDLALTEASRKRADEQLDAATVKVSTLGHDLETSTERESLLERQARELGELISKQHQRVEFAENALRTMACELEDSNMKFCDSISRYADLEALHKQCILSTAAAAAASDSAHANKQSLYSLHEADDPEEREFCASLRQVPRNSKIPSESIHDALTSRTVEHQTKLAPETPICSERAIYRPSVVVSHVEPPKARRDFLNGRWPIWKDPPWRLLYWLRPDSLRFLCWALFGR